MKTTTLEIIDEVNVKFHNLDAKVRRKMVESLRFFIPQARHTPAFKLGRWDGYVSYCTLGGVTQLNLLDKVLPVVIDAGYEIEFDDKRTKYDFEFDLIHENYFADQGKVWPKGHPFEGEPVVLRDYQVHCINKFLTEKQSLQEISTSAGKTIITAALSTMVEKYGKSIVIVPSKNLVVQTEADYKNMGLDVGVYYGERKEIGHVHTISTWQSLEQLVKLGKGLPEDEKPINQMVEDVICVIVDEAHGAQAASLRALLSGPFANSPLRFGLTGTVPKEEHNFMALLGTIGPLTHTLKAKELQDKGVLSNCIINIVQTKEIGEWADYHQEYKFLTTDEKRLEWLAKSIDKIAQTGNTLVLVDRIASGESIQEFLNVNRSGDDLVPLINGAVKVSDRQKEYEEVAVVNNKIIVASYGVAAVGINIPRIFNLVLIEPGKSFVRVIQSIGRGIRKAKDKDFVQIWDMCASTKHSKRHLTKRKQYYDEAQYPYEIIKISRDEDIKV